MNVKKTTSSAEETFKLGELFGKCIPTGSLCFLSGTLGAGKTQFVKGVASGLEIDVSKVTSPTYSIMSVHSGRLTLVHIDAYRIVDPDELLEIGIDDWVNDENVVLIEWAEKVATALPKPDVMIDIEVICQTKRWLNFSLSKPIVDFECWQTFV